MPLTIICPSCSAKIKAPDAAIGKTVKCPKCSSPMIISAPPPEPEIVEAVEVAAPVEEEAPPRPRKKSRRDDGKPRPKKNSNQGVIVGLSIGGVALLSLCCCGGGLGMYYGGMFGNSAGAVFGNARVTYENYNRLKQDMTIAEVEAILGSGKPATAGEVQDMIKSDPSAMGFGRDVALESMQLAYEQAVPKGALYRWKSGGDFIFVLFSASPAAGGKTKHFYIRYKDGPATMSESNGYLS
jgi:DNA-directed RNA polymerase subunit RPC12/RpoP